MNATVKLTTLDEVVAQVRQGRSVALRLTAEQKSALNRARDGWLAKKVLCHLLAARTEDGTRVDKFPLTEAAVVRVASRLGYRVGQKRARQAVKLLVAARVMEPVGSYRPAYTNRPGKGTYRVPLYRVPWQLVAAVRGCSFGRKRAAWNTVLRTSKSPDGKARRRKADLPWRWWQDPLMGSPDGRPPPGLTRGKAAKMMSEYERQWFRGTRHAA